MVLENLHGCAYYEDPKDVVNLNKIFWHLDEEDDFKPSLWHHGL